MRDVNAAIRKKYYELLNGNLFVDNTAIPVYSDYIPNIVNADCYLIIQVISNTSIVTKTSHITNTSVQFSFFTKDIIANAGKKRDTLVSQFYQIIFPYPNSKIDLEPDFQVVFMNLDNDNNLSPLQTDNAIYLNRYITFSHKIYHREIPVS